MNRATDNVEGCGAAGGTFDAQGAFHGYSNDDSSLPPAARQPDPLYRELHTQHYHTIQNYS